MQTVKTERLAADAAGIARAASLLCRGGLVAFGTETVYGLGADAADPRAIAALFAAKQRPSRNPLIVHLADADSAFAQVEAPPLACRLAERFWPGPLTLVLPRRAGSSVCRDAAAGLPTLAVRVPQGSAAQAVLRTAARPIAAPSANRSGRVSPSTAAHVLDGLDGRIDAVLDCGPCPVGLESTVLAVDEAGAALLRPGGITAEAIAALLADCGAAPLTAPPCDPQRPLSPGLLASHYAPRLPVRLDAREADRDEALLAFGTASEPASGLSWNLSPGGDLEEAAARLFAGLRFLDDQAPGRGLSRIAVMTIPPRGLGLAIRDRLQRAAAPR